DGAERDGHALRGDARLQELRKPLGEDVTARVDADQRDVLAAAVALDDLVRHPPQDPSDSRLIQKLTPLHPVFVGRRTARALHERLGYRTGGAASSAALPPKPAKIAPVSTAAIIVIGDEILSGKFADENAAYLIRELRELGVALRRIE